MAKLLMIRSAHSKHSPLNYIQLLGDWSIQAVVFIHTVMLLASC